MRARLLVAALAAGIVSAVSIAPARAQDDTLNLARDAFDKGQSLFEAGSYAEAAAKFEEAYKARPFPQFLFNIGACHEKLKAYDKAADYYRRYLSAEPNAPDKKKTEKRIAALDKAVAELKASGTDPATASPAAPPPQAVANLEAVTPRGLVVIESEPSGAIIYLDDKSKSPLSRTPWNGTLDRQHTVILERPGSKPAEQRIVPDPNKLLVLKVVLAEENYLGWIEITSNVPGAAIYIDDKAVGVRHRTPFHGNLEPGPHKIWVTAEGYDEFYQEMTVVSAETHKINATLKGAPVGYVDIRGRDVEKMKVYLDGAVLCERGPCRKPVAAGEHTLTMKRPDHKSYSTDFDLQAKTQMTVRPRLAPDPSRADAVVAYVVSAAFLGVGVWAGLKAKGLKDDLQADIDAGTPPPDEDDPRFLRGKIYAIGADVAFLAGGITLATAVWFTFRDKGMESTGSTEVQVLQGTPAASRTKRRPRVAVEPQLGPGFGGLGMEVRW